MDTKNLNLQEIGNISNLHKLTYEAWREGKITDLDSVLPVFDKKVSFDDFKSLLDIISNGSITTIATESGFLEKELFITCIESEFLFTNMRLFISKAKDINKDFDCFPISRIESFEYYKNTRRITFYIIGKKFIYENMNDFGLKNVLTHLKNNSLYMPEYNSIKEDLTRINFNNISNIHTNLTQQTTRSNSKDEMEEHNISEILNIGSFIGAVGIVFLLYKISPNARISNIVYIVVLIIGGIIGGLIYNYLSKLK